MKQIPEGNEGIEKLPLISDPAEMQTRAIELDSNLLQSADFQSLAAAGFSMSPYICDEDRQIEFINETFHSDIIVDPDNPIYLRKHLSDGIITHQPCDSLQEAIQLSQLSSSPDDYSTTDLNGNICLCVNGQALAPSIISKLPLTRAALLEILIKIQKTSEKGFESTFGGA